MNRYRVEIPRLVYCSFDVDAESEERALEQAEHLLENVDFTRACWCIAGADVEVDDTYEEEPLVTEVRRG